MDQESRVTHPAKQVVHDLNAGTLESSLLQQFLKCLQLESAWKKLEPTVRK